MDKDNHQQGKKPYTAARTGDKKPYGRPAGKPGDRKPYGSAFHHTAQRITVGFCRGDRSNLSY